LAADMTLDQAATPIVRAGIAQASEDPLKIGRLECAAAQLKLDRINVDGVRPLQIALTVDETAKRRATTVRRQHKAPGRDRGGFAW